MLLLLLGVSGLQLIALRADNGGEFNKLEEKIAKQDGIKMEYTVGYTPEQNGVAERLNRTIFTLVRAMLFEAGLPDNFWGVAAGTAAFIKNRVPQDDGGKLQKRCRLARSQIPAIFVYLAVWRIAGLLLGKSLPDCHHGALSVVVRRPRSDNSPLNHLACLPAPQRLIYSASGVEVATQRCLTRIPAIRIPALRWRAADFRYCWLSLPME